MDQENMVISGENNNRTWIKPRIVEEMDGRKFGVQGRQNRRVLGAINQNIVANPYPCVVTNRGGTSEKNGNSDKNHSLQANRPITRKFAAQIANSQQHYHEESKKQRIEVEESGLREEDEHEKDCDKDQPVPMTLEQAEIDSNEKHHMDEVEMEDIYEESVSLDIDSGDAKNPLAVVEYIEDLYAYYRKVENCSCVSPDYMSRQLDINERMRAILIDWLVEVHHKFELREETLFLTINIIDRFLEKQNVVRKKLQLVGLVAMLLACKYEEVSVPVVDDFVFISAKAYTKKEVLDMESWMLNTLQFNMSVPTPYVFLRRFLKATQSDKKKLELLSLFLIELCLVEYEMTKYPPSSLAAAAVYTAQCTLHAHNKEWNQTCEWHTGYSEHQLLESSRMMVSFHQRAATGKLTGVYRKYNTSRFGHVAKCQPATFLLLYNSQEQQQQSHQQQ
ncbi:unnamed protein product [Cuscuta epithymum]|uniref:Uncharacterized protein n=1 Tax=Cuscuta epithymum TaxID=186058 RepID=A0AAV0D7T3_9ASTE|nr:unnamed protein product [Cuscuta epithymum]